MGPDWSCTDAACPSHNPPSLSVCVSVSVSFHDWLILCSQPSSSDPVSLPAYALSCALQLLQERFFDDTKFFQVLDKPQVKLAQGGVSGDPEVQRKWKHALIKDDPRLVTNRRGTFSFISSVPNSRTPQFLINLSDNGRMMDGRGPYGMVRGLLSPPRLLVHSASF